MLWLGTSSGPEAMQLIRDGEIGLMATWLSRPPVAEAAVWAADNGCYAQPHRFDLGRYLGWLEELAPYRSRCLFATAQDAWGNAAATLERSLPQLPLIRAAGYPAALVAQDGLELLEVPWAELDVLFVGGSEPWRTSPACRRLAAEARARGKGLHVGRINSWRRLEWARGMGADWADGTLLRFGPDANISRVREWVRRIADVPTLGLEVMP